MYGLANKKGVACGVQDHSSWSCPNVLNCDQCPMTLPETCVHGSDSSCTLLCHSSPSCEKHSPGVRTVAFVALQKKTRNIIRNITKLLKTQLETTFTQKESTKKRQKPTKTFLDIFSFRNDSEFLFDLLFCSVDQQIRCQYCRAQVICKFFVTHTMFTHAKLLTTNCVHVFVRR